SPCKGFLCLYFLIFISDSFIKTFSICLACKNYLLLQDFKSLRQCGIFIFKTYIDESLFFNFNV
ncbi:hypothetical protein LR59_08785, partial [Campylobacter sp. MIT 97-5078]